MPLVLLQTFDNYFQANVVLARLQEEGVVCFLENEIGTTVYPILNNTISGIRLVVSADDWDKAKNIMLQIEAEKPS